MNKSQISEILKCLYFYHKIDGNIFLKHYFDFVNGV